MEPSDAWRDGRTIIRDAKSLNIWVKPMNYDEIRSSFPNAYLQVHPFILNSSQMYVGKYSIHGA